MAYITENHIAHRRSTPILGRLSHFYNVWRQRQALKSLNREALEDIGISYRDASNEARRSFWDAPSTWRH